MNIIIKNFEKFWNLYVVTMDTRSLTQYLALIDDITAFFEENNIFLTETKNYIFDKVNKLFFKSIKFDLVNETKTIIGKIYIILNIKTKQ